MAKGYEVVKGKIRVDFFYNGERIREPLGLSANDENILYAQGLSATIRHEIKTGSFNLSKHFPNSKRLKESRINHWVDMMLDIKQSQVAPSTIINYRRWADKYIKPKWGRYQSEDIDAIDIEEWISSDLDHLSSKSIKDILSVMRMTYQLYRMRNRSAYDPTEGIRIALPDDDEPNAFSLHEIDRISTTDTQRMSERNAATFALWTGARPSEWLALSWNDVDVDNREALFKRAIVLGQYKSTKTKRSKRSIDLLQPAIDCLRQQYLITGKLKSLDIKVLQRDNRTTRKESFRPVFVNNSTMEPYKRVKYYESYFWQQHLINAGVDNRGVSLCRHTFTSQMLAAGMDIRWICDQLGHTSDAMLRKKYAKYFKKDRRINPADTANDAFGFNKD